MPKVGIQPIRRRQLIQATIESIHAHGYDGTTIARIATRAGLSAGLISHYFGSKGELLEATMRSLLTDLQRQVVARLKAARTTMERVEELVDANFDEVQITPQLVTAWLAFWAQVPHEPRLKRLQAIYHRRLRSNFRPELRRLGLSDEGSSQLTDLVISLIDGIWVQAALNGLKRDASQARQLIVSTLRLHLGAGSA